ncbi:MAG TPA: TIGR03564 family F420-dependent LLM class oxidoreductase [Acidimicrobiales bacterium]
MRIGISGGAATTDAMIDQAVRAEADGFTSLWYASAIGGDPLVAMALAGRATTTIELGTSVLQTYTSHPVLMAARVASVVGAMGRPGFTLGIGPSHRPNIEGGYGLSYAHPGRHTEEYVHTLTALLRGGPVDVDGEEFHVHTTAPAAGAAAAVPVLVAALAPRLLRVAGQSADGTILWMGTAAAIETHVAPRIRAAASTAGRPEPRIVAGLPVAVHDDVDEARAAAAQLFAGYGELPNYRRLLDIGRADGPGDAAIVGDEATVTAALQALFDAGATDMWAAMFPVGADRSGSRARTRALLRELAARP